MLRNLSVFICVAILFISGCSSIPKKNSVILNPTLVQQLYDQHLPQKLSVPVQSVQTKNLTDTWGASRSNGRLHEGIDIFAPRGTKVFSTTKGLVADLGSNNLGGKVIWIFGPNGSWHYYAHLDGYKRGLKVGDYIKTGDLIGYVGNTGNAKHSAPHLHYGIYLNGKGRGAINPYPYLR